MGHVTGLLKLMPKGFWKLETMCTRVHPPPYEGERKSLTVLRMWLIKKSISKFWGLRKELGTQGSFWCKHALQSIWFSKAHICTVHASLKCIHGLRASRMQTLLKNCAFFVECLPKKSLPGREKDKTQKKCSNQRGLFFFRKRDLAGELRISTTSSL